LPELSYPCPCCGYLVFDEEPGSLAICPICFWEDDQIQLRRLLRTGANQVSLIEAQRNYARFGACERRLMAHVRPPRPDDLREPGWRPIDPFADNIHDVSPTLGEELTSPEALESLYYWRRGANS
jgi:cysteine-rich CPCC protein